MKKVLLILALSGFIISCSANEPMETRSDSVRIETIQKEFAGTTWKLSKYLSDDQLKDVTETSKADLKFEGGKFYGNGSVNRYFGSYTLNNSELSMGRIGTTLMMGPEDAMQQEYAFTALLQKVTSYEIVGEELKLFSDGKLILVLTEENK
ncbi:MULTISPECIES: META domain-containing protein [Psychrilyobacter]|uniref:META domain-containing protein n=1 Tax=Psychrilyobacter piezotolerans TaxID=2293438 RepID=A0ABX9KI49_9FUSO|nr:MULTISPECIES: META domain-containing protein [Psychrilyobacter]MCS5421814.1 META domain-containing protein [Psychrilyobacter sp. S5]NDI77588.1 META domain-containing protein [Psychrilyobacter piezotolerans]RDE62904.1 META domain-containing protein [Psychrilyobacter sp. S5]REI41662.1 META domain-containing protein [Psychrilyobacter piezotolerans]